MPLPVAVRMTTLVAARERTSCARALYAGLHGAANWLDVVNDPAYPLSTADAFGVRANRLAAVRDRSVATVVSLGPGDGREDVEIVTALRATSPSVRYIPVDISVGLLDLAAGALARHVDVPTAVHADFEREHDAIEDALARYGPPPRLFLLLGGTIGNLDFGESAFFRELRRLMSPADVLLMDVPLAGPGWSIESEPRLQAASYAPSFRRFLAGGLIPAASGDDAERFVEEFEERVALSLLDNRFRSAQTMTVADRRTRRVLLRMTRYDWRVTVDWLIARNWCVLDARSSLKHATDPFGMGVVLLA